MEDITEVCRLCLLKKTLVWIFDTRINVADIKNIIYVTTGVKISSNDAVSQKVCSKCLQIATKMYEFRLASQKADSTLKDKHKLYVEKKLLGMKTNISAEKDPLPAKRESNPTSEMKDKKPAISVHPSIKEISAKHPNILIPKKCLKLNMLPEVCLLMNEVETYFEKRKINFQKHVRQVLRSIKKDVDTDSGNIEASDCSLKNDSSENTESLPSNLDVVMPIKIATNKTGYAIVSKAQPTVSTEDEKNKCIDETGCNKRKLSETETESTTTNKKIITNTDTSALQIGKSVPLYICDICNSVQYSLNVLNKHKLKHLICQFCKVRFKSLEKKEQHLENDCAVKKLKSSCLIPCLVALEKLELNRSIRAKYPRAFTSFPPLAVTKDMGESSVIEIVDDDESVNETNETKTSKKSTQVDEALKINSNGTINQTSENSKSNNNSLLDLNMHLRNGIKHNDTKPEPTPEIITSVSLVKPNIKIKNNSILDYMDPKASDIKLMRDFLTTYKNLNSCSDQSTQTELLVNSSIVTNHAEVTTEFKGLKTLLHFYKIPVIIKNGEFSVSYTCDNVTEKKKNMCLWDSLVPVDIAEPKKVSATVPKTRPIAKGPCTTTLPPLNSTPEETTSAPTMVNNQNSAGTQKENCQSEKSKTSSITGSSASLQLSSFVTVRKAPHLGKLPSMTAQDPNSSQNLLNAPLTNPVSVLQSTASSSNIIGSIANNVHLRVAPEKSANSSETGGPPVPYPIVQSANPTMGLPVPQSINIQNNVLLPPQTSRSSVLSTVQHPHRDLQPIINKVGNVPQLLPMTSAKDSTLQATSENTTLGETPLPALGSIRVKSLTDLT
nr:unnamed protein product [Callosobruchus chinensis]